jgi:hypothetical protein
MADRYWVGGTGNWSNTARWSTTSGGAGGASVPGVGDNAIFNISSDVSVFDFTVTVDSAVTVDNLTFSTIEVGITLSSAGNLTVTGTTSINRTTNAERDPFVRLSGNGASLGDVVLTAGDFNINGTTVNMRTFSSNTSSNRRLLLGTNATIRVTGNDATVWNFTTAGVSSFTGSGTIDFNYSGSTGTRTIQNTPDAGGGIPNILISAGSDTVVFNTSTTCRSLDFTGFSGTFSGSNAFTVAGSITLDAGMTYTHTGTVTITGTGTLITAGKTFSAVTVDGTGITVTLGDALNISTRVITVTRGTFTTSASNYNITAGRILSEASFTRTINLNGSTVTLSSNAPISFAGTVTLTAGTSQIDLTSAGATLTGGNQTFYNVSFTNTSAGAHFIGGANTFNNLTLNASASGLSQLQLSANQTVNGTFTCAGSSATQRGFVLSSIIGTTRTITAAAVSANDCDFRDITIAGAAAPISPTRGGDCGGNSGITFPAAKTVYRVGFSADWDNAWAASSGGSGSSANFPLAQDTAVFDNNIGAATSVNPGSPSNSNWNCGTLDFSARTDAFTFNAGGNLTIYGSFILGSGVTVTGISTQTFSGRGTQTFTSAGKHITFTTTVNKPAGAFELGDALVGANAITLTQGTFDAKNYNLTCFAFRSNNSNTRTITMGSGLWTLTGTGTALWDLNTTTGLTFNKDTADILLSNDASSISRTFGGGGLTYNKLTIGGATATGTTTTIGSGTFSEIGSLKTVAHTILSAGTLTQAFGTWSVTGTSGNVVTFRSSSTGTRRTINLTNATSGIDYLDVRDIGITDPNKFYVGANSIDSGNNLNVIFASGPSATATGNMFMLFN